MFDHARDIGGHTCVAHSNVRESLILAMDYGKIPPEINSVRMYAGFGADSMRAAAAAWGGIANELRAAATKAWRLTAGISDRWRDAAASSLRKSSAAHVDWLNSTAGQCEQTAAQVIAAAGAYETALAETVPPRMIDANYTLRARLVAVNFFSQYSPLIAAAEADYERMWAQDAEAMYGYADACAAAATFAPFVSPPNAATMADHEGDRADASDEEALATGVRIVSRLPRVLETLSSAGPERFGAALLATASSLARMGSLRSRFAKDASVPVAVAITNAAKAAGRSRAEVTAVCGAKDVIGPLSVPHGWDPTAPTSAAVPVFHRAPKRSGDGRVTRSGDK